MRNPLRPQWLKFIPLSCCQPRAPLLAFVPRRIATTTARNAAPVDLPELIVSPGSPRHNSLSTFLKWAERSQIEPSKTVFVGTHYEYMTALALRRLGFSLLRIGRRGDAGIDLIGHWILAPLQEPMPVIVQCKVRRISLNPSTIREMEGSFQGIPAGWNKAEVLGLIVTTQKATSGMLKALAHSRSALGFVLITRAGTIQQFVWNRAASERGLEGVGVTVRHTPRAMLSEAEADQADQDVPKPSKQDVKYKHAGTEKDIQLTWMGSPIFPERNDGTPETLEMFGQAVHGSNTYPHIDKRMDPSLKRCVGRNMTAEDAPSPRGGEIPRRAGRPPGAKNKAKLGESPPPLVTAERKAPAISAQPIRVSGRRGRPRKIKDTIKAGATVIVKRGRPRKIEHIEAVTVVPAKRGRPRKIECIEANTTVPAKRGRPPKTEHIEATTTMAAKRGRPKGSKNKRETLGEG